MGWKHIVIEGFCSYDRENDSLKASVGCVDNAGTIGLYCLKYNEDSRQICPYFGFGTARSTLILTGKDGEAVKFRSFVLDDGTMREEEWLKNEEKWIKSWRAKLDE